MGAATVAKRIMPLFDRVLVQRAVAETKTKGGLLIPETAQKSPLEATVVASGPGARNANTGETIPMSVAVGDRVDARVGKQQAGAGRPGVPRDQGDRHRRQALGLVRTQ